MKPAPAPSNDDDAPLPSVALAPAAMIAREARAMFGLQGRAYEAAAAAAHARFREVVTQQSLADLTTRLAHQLDALRASGASDEVMQAHRSVGSQLGALQIEHATKLSMNAALDHLTAMLEDALR